MPNEIVVPGVDHGISEGEVERASLARVETVNHVEIRVRNILRRRKSGQELAEYGGRQRAERVSAVEKHRLALATGWLLVHINNGTVGLVYRNSVNIDPESGQTVGGFFGRDDRALDEVSGILLGVDATEDDGSCSR